MYTGAFDVMFYVTDLGKSVAFWRDALGVTFKGFWDDENHTFCDDFEKVSDGVSYLLLDAGGQALSLHLTDKAVPGGAAVYHLEVGDVDAMHARMVENGLTPTDPQDMPWRWRMTFVNDPDGHCIGLYQNLGGEA